MTLTVPRPRRRLAAAAAALALVPLAGCGSDDKSSSSSGKGPAALTPAGALVYGDINVSPTGDQLTQINTLIAKFAPGKNLDTLLTKLKSDDGKTQYARDVKPWLGQQIGFALTGFAGKVPQYVAVLDSKDDGKALSFVKTTATKSGAYKGVDLYKDNKDPTTFNAVSDGEVLAGTDAGIKAAIDTAKGGAALTTVSQYTSLRKSSGDGLGFVYGDVGKILDATAASGVVSATDQAGVDAIREYVSAQGLTAFGATLTAKADRVGFNAVTASKPQPGEGQAATAVQSLPGGALAAFGIGDLGASLTQVLDLTKSVKTPTAAGGAAPAQQLQQGLDQIKAATGLDVQQDLLSWMGSAGLFVRGSSLSDAGGALVVQSKDAAKTKTALDKIAPLVKSAGLTTTPLTGSGIDDGFSLQPNGLPVQVYVALAGSKFIVAVNKDALDSAISPSTKLADDPAYKAAAATLGNGISPSAFIDFKSIDAIVSLLAGSQPQFQMAKPYLDKITTIVGGSKREGNLLHSSVVVGIR